MERALLQPEGKKTMTIPLLPKLSTPRLLLLLLGFLPAPLAAQPRVNIPHGIYSRRLLLRVTPTDSQAELRYTTDGSEPTAQSPLCGRVLATDTTLILRAAEFRNGERTSPILTASYIFPEHVLRQPNNPAGYPSTWGAYRNLSGTAIADYEMDPEMTCIPRLARLITSGLSALPVLSIVTDRGNLFNKQKDPQTGGIYIYTGTTESDGRGWERPASVELFGGPADHDMSVDCALTLHGGAGRNAEANPRHSFRLLFKSAYGPSKLDYPVYGQRGVDRFNSLIVRSFLNFAWTHTNETQRTRAQYTRDLWARHMQQRMGYPTSDGQYVHLFLNGLYWGVYNLTERIDDAYCKYHFGGRREDYDIVKREDQLETADGTLDAWLQLMRLSGNASDDATYQQIIGERPLDDGQLTELLDVDNFIDYMLINFYIGNRDWDHHNWLALRNRLHLNQGFRFICWDSENSLHTVGDNVLGVKNTNCPTALFHNMMKHPQFLHRFIDRAWLHLTSGGLLTEGPTLQLWDSLYHVIAPALYDEAARWGDYRRDVHPYSTQGQLYTVDNQYMAERNRMRTTFFPQRTQQLIQQLRARGWYTPIDPPRFLVNGEEAACDTLRADDELTLDAAENYIFYTTDATQPVTWFSAPNGMPTTSAFFYEGENLAERMGEDGRWVTLRAVAWKGKQWSATVERRFYLAPATGMASLRMSPLPGSVYDLQGRLMPRGPLPPGIYIQNGRKVRVK